VAWYDHIKQEVAVIKSAPLAVILFSGVGMGIATWYFAGQIASLKEQINAQDGQIRRYRVALGIDKASRGAMVELTNWELRAMALNIVPKVRDLCSSLAKRSEAIRPSLQSNNPATKRQGFERLQALSREVSEQYDRAFRSDRVLLNNEILRRLDRNAAAVVIRVPLFDAETGTPLSFSTLMGSTGVGVIDAGMMCMAADETEQLAKLLPVAEQKR
jgi:hypothetical protein